LVIFPADLSYVKNEEYRFGENLKPSAERIIKLDNVTKTEEKIGIIIIYVIITNIFNKKIP